MLRKEPVIFLFFCFFLRNQIAQSAKARDSDSISHNYNVGRLEKEERENRARSGNRSERAGKIARRSARDPKGVEEEGDAPLRKLRSALFPPRDSPRQTGRQTRGE